MDELLFAVEPPLPYPTRRIPAAWGSVEEYEIPANERAGVLKRMYPFEPIPNMGDTMYDLHEEKTFRVSDFLVVRDCGMNMLVSPYYPQSGGTVIDWMPQKFTAGGCHRRKIRGRAEEMVTYSFGPKAKF
ncbi:MAG: hypothetical protein JW843_07755 [Candidatus Aminicenantes bacterium]|nr:hypothetical protein [Candidatus Aminicenantes bacterium]